MDCRETCAKLEDFFHDRLPADELDALGSALARLHHYFNTL